MIIKAKGTVTVPPRLRGIGQVVSWGKSVNKSIQQLRDRSWDVPNQQRGGSGGKPLRFEFLGLSKTEDDQWQVRVSPGVVNYNKTELRGVFEDAPKTRYVRGIFPMVDIDGAGDFVRIDDDSKPGMLIGGKADGAIWLKCSTSKCGTNSAFDDEEVVLLTDRDEEPEGENGQTFVLIAQFDIETDGDSKSITNLYSFLQSDWEQPFLCEDDDAGDSSINSIDSSWPFSSSSTSGDISDLSGSSSEGSGGDADCQVAMTAVWVNVKDCFPVDTSVFPASSCIPKEFTFEVKVRFFFRGTFGGVECQAYAYGVKFDGGVTIGDEAGATVDEYRWQNDTERTLKFKVKNPNACNYVNLPWRVKTFPPLSAFGGGEVEDEGCCGQEFTGSATLQLSTPTEGVAVRKLPQTCGDDCECSTGVIPP